MNVLDLYAKISLDPSEYEDGLSKASSKMSAFANHLKSGLETAAKGFEAVEGVGKKAADVVMAAGKAFLAASSAMAGFSALAVKTGMEFDSTMSTVQALTGATGESLEELRQKAIQMGNDTVFSASEAAEAMTYMGMAGWETGDILNGLSGVMNLAAASGEDLATTADIVTDALTAFGMAADESGRFADVLAATATSANTDVGKMGETFKYVAPLAGALGYSIEDTSLAIGLMANSGIKASEAGTALRSTLTRLTKPTKESETAMKALGISATYTDGSMKPLSFVLGELRNSFSGLTESEKANYAAMLAGQEAMSGLLAIVNASDADFRKLESSIRDSTGAAEEMANVKLDNLAGDVKYLQSAFGTLQITISDALKGSLREFVQFGTKAITALTEGFQSNGVTGLFNALSGIITDTIVLLVEKAPEFVNAGIKFVESIATGIINARYMVWETLNNLLVSMTSEITEWIQNHANEIKETGIVLIQLISKGFTSAVDVITNSIGEFIPLIANAFLTYHQTLFEVGVEILAAIGRGIVENRYELQNMATRTIQNIVTALRENAPMIIEGAITLMEVLTQAVIDNLPLIMEAGAEIINRLVAGISEASPAVQAIIGVMILPKLLKIIDVVMNIGKAVSSISGTVINVISSIGSVAGNVISSIITGMQTLWTTMMSNPITIVIAAVAALVAAFVLLWNNCEGFRDFWINLGESLKSAALGAVEAITNAFQEGWESVRSAWAEAKGFFISVKDGIISVFSSAWGQFKSIGSNILGGIWEGISEGAGRLLKNITEFFGGMVDGIKRFLGIHSPSRVFAGIGENMALGLGEGWENEFGRIKDQIENGMEFGTASAGMDIRNGLGAGGYGSGIPGNSQMQEIVIPITINLTDELDGAVLGRKMVRYNVRAENLVGTSLVNFQK